MQAMSECQPLWIQEVLNSYVTDSKSQQLLSALAIHNPNEKGLELCQGLIKCQGRIWIGANSALQTKIINAFHASAIGRHSGVRQLTKG